MSENPDGQGLPPLIPFPELAPPPPAPVPPSRLDPEEEAMVSTFNQNPMTPLE